MELALYILAYFWIFGAWPIAVWARRRDDKHGYRLRDDLIATAALIAYMAIGWLLIEWLASLFRVDLW